MPRYFFDLKDGQEFPDLQGSEFPNLAAARLEAVRYSAEVLKEMPERFWNCEEWTMSVAGSDRKPLFTLKFLAETAPSQRIISFDSPLSRMKTGRHLTIFKVMIILRQCNKAALGNLLIWSNRCAAYISFREVRF